MCFQQFYSLIIYIYNKLDSSIQVQFTVNSYKFQSIDPLRASRFRLHREGWTNAGGWSLLQQKAPPAFQLSRARVGRDPLPPFVTVPFSSSDSSMLLESLDPSRISI